MINMGFDFERRLNDMLRNSMAVMSVRPITLGGIIGPSGGTGGPVGGYIGQLAQSFITYDTTEAAINTPVVVSGFSLVTNLNKIRYDINQLGVEIDALTSGTGAQYFIDLLDAPGTYTGSTGKAVVVNGTEDGLEFYTLPTVLDTFLELTDTPDSYTSQNNKYVKVKADATGLEFATVSGTGGADDFLELVDTPNTYVGQANKYVKVNSGETALEFITISGGGADTFLELTDTPDSYTGLAGKAAVVKATEDGLEFVTVSGGSGGDMFKSQYDVDNNGLVDYADLAAIAEAIGGALNYVSSNTPLDGQVLQWSDFDGQFNFVTMSGGVGGGDVATDTIWNAKGDLAVGTGADTASRLSVGTNGKILMADSTQATGIKWETPSTPAAPSLDGLSDVVITDPVNYETIVYLNGTWVNMETVSGESSNLVASDVIWDAKGDLVVGTGANTAQKLTVGTNGYVLMSDSAETTGLRWGEVTSSGGGTLYGYKVFNPDIPPASGTVYDDEFNNSSIDAKWTNFDPNTPDQFVATETTHGLELRKTTVSGKVAGYIQDFSALTSGQSYSIFTKVSAMGTKYSVGFLFANDAYNNPSTADLWTAGMIFDTTWSTGQRMEWSSYSASTSELLLDIAIGEKTFYIRCRIRAGGDSGATDTHIYLDYSPDGYNWVERDNFYTNFLTNQVGIYVRGYDTDDSRAQAIVHYFRYKAESAHEGATAWYSQVPGGQFIDK